MEPSPVCQPVSTTLAWGRHPYCTCRFRGFDCLMSLFVMAGCVLVCVLFPCPPWLHCFRCAPVHALARFCLVVICVFQPTHHSFLASLCVFVRVRVFTRSYCERGLVSCETDHNQSHQQERRFSSIGFFEHVWFDEHLKRKCQRNHSKHHLLFTPQHTRA